MWTFLFFLISRFIAVLHEPLGDKIFGCKNHVFQSGAAWIWKNLLLFNFSGCGLNSGVFYSPKITVLIT